jgi:predicted N-acetyltransferase YhbS
VKSLVPESNCLSPILPERPEDTAEREPLLDLSFGADRHQKTVYSLREGVEPVVGLSFSVRDAGRLVGAIRFWPVSIANRVPAVLLGPLAVDPARRGEGIGRALVRHGLNEAIRQGHRICLLVGDAPYYEPFGFHSAPALGLALPGWVDPARFLVRALQPGALDNVTGVVGKAKAPRRRKSKAA